MKSRGKVRIEHHAQICRTPALAIAVEGWHDLSRRGVAEEIMMIQYDDESLTAFVGDAVAAVLTYCHTQWCKQISVRIGYVRPQYRRMGLYTRLWRELVRRGKAAGALQIESSTALDNAPMRAQARACGRIERGVLLTYDLG